MRTSWQKVLLAGIVLSGCAKHENAKNKPSSSETAVNAAPAEASSVPRIDGPVPVPPKSQMSLPERFDSEAQNRPKGTPTAEQAFAAFTGASLELHGKKQHLASLYQALYCVGAESNDDVALSLCEYPNEASATKGREMSQKAFGAIVGREVFQNKGTTLTVLRVKKTPEAAAKVTKMRGLFSNLKPNAA